MLKLTSSMLRRALDLQEKIELLQEELALVLGKDASSNAVASVVTSRRSGRKAAVKKSAAQASEALDKNRRKKRISPLKGKKRPSSPSGPLAPAVLRVMKRGGKPMNVDAVLQGLKSEKYVWKVSDAKKNLSARIYTLPGVKKVGPGLFALAKK